VNVLLLLLWMISRVCCTPLHCLPLQTRESDRPPDMLLLMMRPDRLGYCHFDGQVRLRKRKRQEGDEPRPEKVKKRPHKADLSVLHCTIGWAHVS
jgi:hypothetical protein